MGKDFTGEVSLLVIVVHYVYVAVGFYIHCLALWVHLVGLCEACDIPCTVHGIMHLQTHYTRSLTYVHTYYTYTPIQQNPSHTHTQSNTIHLTITMPLCLS